ncbi:MAG: 16S rRNA processing protein RimM [Flavobacteriales bacterium]|nr:16S rRNA processing protein RimM [Flavobacteriales bacterium]
MQIKDCYLLGRITKKHGIKGQVVLSLDTDDLDAYNKLESVLLSIEGKLVPFFITNKDWNPKGKLIVTFEDVDFNLASEIINKEAYLPLSTLPKLEGNKFYFHEIIGFSLVNTSTQNTIGEIISVNDETAQNLFFIKNKENKESIIPIIDEWIVEVNRQEKVIKMNLPEGIENL